MTRSVIARSAAGATKQTRHDSFVYMMANAFNTVIYTGVTRDLEQRVNQHKDGQGSRFTKKYQVTKLVYYEQSPDIRSAIMREKQIKSGSRKQKMNLIESMNPKWKDLATFEVASPLARLGARNDGGSK